MIELLLRNGKMLDCALWLNPVPSTVMVCYDGCMVRQIDAIFSQGAFRPLEPLSLPEGTRVHLSVEADATPGTLPPAAKIRTPRLAHPVDAADFVMDVQESGDASI
jgi:predicted DNA-binding antitoxin AbrB/MazE fold protein